MMAKNETFTMRMPPDLRKKLDELAAADHRTAGNTLRVLIEQAYKELEKK